MITASTTTLRKIFTLVAMMFSLSTLAQTKQANLKNNSVKPPVPFKQKDTTYWVVNFRQFRDAIFQKDKKKAKVFFDFPIKNESNEIWHLVYDYDIKAFDKIPSSLLQRLILRNSLKNCLQKISQSPF